MEKKITDGEIIELFFARDERALTLIGAKYGKYLHTVAFNILHDELDCEECINDAYLAAWETIPPENPRSLKAFLTRLIRFKSINRYKRNCAKRRIPSEFTLSLDELHAALESGEDMGAELSAQKLGGLIDTFINSLSERKRYIFIERYYMAQPAEHIARELGLSVWSVYKELDKIREDLRSYLAENEVFV